MLKFGFPERDRTNIRIFSQYPHAKKNILPAFFAAFKFSPPREQFRPAGGNFVRQGRKEFFFKQHLTLLGANVIFGLNAPIAKAALSDKDIRPDKNPGENP